MGLESKIILWCTASSIFFGLIVLGNPQEPRGQTKKFQNSLNQQNLQTLLNSIEDRLRNLDNVYSMQYSPSVEGRLAHFSRKLEAMESKITRLEAVVSNEIEKLLENLNGRNFKNDIANEHVIRKIDNSYERLNHRVIYTEGKIDMSEKKLENKLNMVISKLDKLEENLTVRDSDLQDEISEVTATVEEVKAQSDNVLEKLENITRSVKNIQESPKENIFKNATSSEKDIKKQLDVLSDKMINFHEYSWSTFNRIEGYLRSIGLVTNQSRYEVQSGLRSLTIEVGRMAGNRNIIDNSKGREKLEELEKKMDDNFNSIMLAQHTFLESCYRVQGDEAQLESKIGEVLEKLLDTFSQKTVVEPKDIRRIEQILKNHDQYMRKSSVDTVKTIASILQKDYNFEKKLDNTFSTITTNLESLQNSINEQIADDTFDQKLEDIITSLKDLQSLTIDINTNIKTTIRDVFPSFQELKALIESLRSQTKEDMIRENFEGLNRVLQEIKNRIITQFTRNPGLNETESKNFNNNTQINFIDTDGKVNCLDLPIDVRSSADCINTTVKDPIAFPNEAENATVNCLDLPIDVRTVINCNNSTVTNSTIPSNPDINKLITDIFLRNVTIFTNITDSDESDNTTVIDNIELDINAEESNIQNINSTEIIEISDLDKNEN